MWGTFKKTGSVKIAILTTARSDFGPLKRVIRKTAERFPVDLLIAGSHSLGSRGNSVQEIVGEFGQSPNINLVRFDSMVDGDSAADQVQTLAATQQLASRWFSANECDLLLFLGDRWELWGVTLPAFLHGIPMAHISGGELTEGAIDDAVRHSHTKLSALHFAATEAYAYNISRMGEEDWRINVVGECGLDQIYDSEFATPAEIKQRFDIDLKRDTLLVTYHPSTLDFDSSVAVQIGALLQALEAYANRQLVFTAPGMEQGAQIVLDAVHAFVKRHPATRFVDHLGSRNYLSVMRSAKVVIGNSSSGLVEAASFGVPSINVGMRQKNRMAAKSVQHVGYDSEAIRIAIDRALSDEYQRFARTCPNPYDPFGDGRNSERIVDAIDHVLAHLPMRRLLMKRFDAEVCHDRWNSLLNGECPS